jgi:hypothetical protein
MPDLTWLHVLVVLVFLFVAGFGWTCGSWLATRILTALFQ